MAGRNLRSRRLPSMSASPTIAVVGGLNMDEVYSVEDMPVLGESKDSDSLQFLPGGKGANTAVAAYRASHSRPAKGDTSPPATKSLRATESSAEPDIRVFMNGAVGKDDYGQRLKEQLEKNGVDIDGVLTKNEMTGTCAVFVEMASGESRNVAYQGANRQYKLEDPKRVESLTGKTGVKPDLIIAHLGIKREVVQPLLALASRNGVDTVFNPSPALHVSDQTYRSVTHLILNEQECTALSEYADDADDLLDPQTRHRVAKDFLDRGVKNVIITLGARGAYWATKFGQGDVSAEKVEPEDTTGAGDSFVAAYAVDYLRQRQRGVWVIESAIRFACKAAARTIMKKGAQEALPWADEIE